MQFNKQQLTLEANNYHFVRDTYEKVIRLMDILSYIRSTPFLFKHLALKGGTAINLTIFDLPRLSVDIDFDFTSNISKDEMMNVRHQIKDLLFEYFNKNNYQVSEQSRTYHALDSFKISYINSGNNPDSIKIEINYILRAHVYEPIIINNKQFGMIPSVEIRTLNPIEIFGSKLVALMTRATPRDLYDFSQMINSELFDKEAIQEVKRCAVFYRALSSEDSNLNFDLANLNRINQNMIKRFLAPVIHSSEFFSLSIAKEITLNYFNQYFILNDSESRFLSNFANKSYTPELLFYGEQLERIINHPLAIWKTRNI